MPKVHQKKLLGPKKQILQPVSSSDEDEEDDFSDEDYQNDSKEEGDNKTLEEEKAEASGDDEDEVDDDDGDDGDEDEEEMDEEEERTAIRNELASLTFAELEALKSKIGAKEWNEAMFGSSSKSSQTSRKKAKKIFKRDNKNRPKEVSSKMKPKRVREVVHVTKVRTRDPRFEDLCGEYDEKIWSKNYDFIQELRQKEVQDLKGKLKETKDDTERQTIRDTLQKLANKERSDAAKKEKAEKIKKDRDENIQRMKEGKKPYFMKKSTKKFVELAEKYDKLKESGKLDSYLKKKRKKNATRDRKTLPSTG